MVPGLRQNKAVHRTVTTDQDSRTILVVLIGRCVLRQPLSPETYLEEAELMSGIEESPIILGPRSAYAECRSDGQFASHTTENGGGHIH